MIVEATKKIVENMDLTADEAAQVMDEMMSGEAEQIWHPFSPRLG